MLECLNHIIENPYCVVYFEDTRYAQIAKTLTNILSLVLGR